MGRSDPLPDLELEVISALDRSGMTAGECDQWLRYLWGHACLLRATKRQLGAVLEQLSLDPVELRCDDVVHVRFKAYTRKRGHVEATCVISGKVGDVWLLKDGRRLVQDGIIPTKDIQRSRDSWRIIERAERP